jgi:UDP-N-acetylglucosamine 2-epimerase
MIRIGEEWESQGEDGSWQPADTSLAYFCQFVDDYTRHATDSMSTAAVCEHQAAGIQLIQQDVNQETIYMLIETMLNVIDHLEKKWLDEQLRHEELLRREYLRRRRERNWLKFRCQMWIRQAWKRVVRDKRILVTHR